MPNHDVLTKASCSAFSRSKVASAFPWVSIQRRSGCPGFTQAAAGTCRLVAPLDQYPFPAGMDRPASRPGQRCAPHATTPVIGQAGSPFKVYRWRSLRSVQPRSKIRRWKAAGLTYSSNRNLLASRYSSTSSAAIQRRPRRSATAPVVFEPANGSTIKSLSSVSSLMKNSGSTAGKRAG